MALAAILAAELVGAGRLADWSAPVSPGGPSEEIPLPTPISR